LEVHFLEISYNTKYYKEACRLRDDILRKPLGMSLYDQNLEEEKDHIHIIGKSFEDDVIAYLQFKIIDEKLAKMQQVVVSQQHQSKGIGKKLINFSENFISSIGINSILLHAREPVVGFYEKLGYAKFGEKFLEVTIPHHKMNKNLI
jgi:predicted GNAT family N-acyltransferase|tara:strand:+ start:174 stop:614 length:441 start_codon:yes stop_codon:yes gene_type:complete